MARGGSRNGRKGAAYSNRTDLQTGAKPLPVTTAPGQPYGAAKAQADAQAAIPMAPTPLPPAVPNGMAPEPAHGTMPGELTSLTAPSMRPDEPLTHGLGVGPGAGPDIFHSAPDPVLKGLAILNSLPHLPPSLQAVKDSLAVAQMNGAGPSDNA